MKTLAAVLAPMVWFGVAGAAEVPDSALVTAITARFARLDNVTAEFHQRETYHPSASFRGFIDQLNRDLPPERQHRIRVDAVDSDWTIRLLDQRAFYDRKPSGDRAAAVRAGHIAEFDELIESFCPDRTERLQVEEGGKKLLGAILPPQRPPDDWLEAAIGVRLAADAERLTAKRLGTLRITSKTSEKVVGELTDSRGRAHSLEFDPTQGYALSADTIRGNHRLVEVRASRWGAVSGIPMPYHVEYRSAALDASGNEEVRVSTVIDVRDYRIEDPHNSKDSFRIVWPLHARIADARTGETFVMQSRPHALDDDELIAAMKRKHEGDAASLRQTQAELDRILRGTPSSTQPAGSRSK